MIFVRSSAELERELSCQVQVIKAISQNEGVKPLITYCEGIISKKLNQRKCELPLFHLPQVEGQVDQHRLGGHLTVEGARNKRLQRFYGPWHGVGSTKGKG